MNDVIYLLLKTDKQLSIYCTGCTFSHSFLQVIEADMLAAGYWQIVRYFQYIDSFDTLMDSNQGAAGGGVAQCTSCLPVTKHVILYSTRFCYCTLFSVCISRGWYKLLHSVSISVSTCGLLCPKSTFSVCSRYVVRQAVGQINDILKHCFSSPEIRHFNPLKGRDVKWLHLAIQV